MEILIGKFIDSEITPAEQKLLDTELQNNPDAQILLRQWQQLHEQTEQVLAAEVLENGQSPQDIFRRAVTVHDRNRWKRRLRPTRWLPISGSVAAGLLAGIGLFSLMTNKPFSQDIPNETNRNNETVRVDPANTRKPEPADSPAGTKLVELIPDRPLEYYIYTDPDGSHYVVETPVEETVNLARYYEDLH